VILLVAFVLPGFVTQLIAERTHIVPRRVEPFERLLRALYYSTWVYVLLGFGVWLFEQARGKHLSFEDVKHQTRADHDIGALALLAFISILVLPVLVATSGRLWVRLGQPRATLLRLLRIDPGHSTPTAWDFVFDEPTPRFVRAVLSDGRVIGGLYARGSFSTYAEQSGDLFLHERWELRDDDLWFLEPASGTAGIWLPNTSIVSLEFYDVRRGDEESASTREAGGTSAGGGPPERESAGRSSAERSQ
jgi:hypothetical protein